MQRMDTNRIPKQALQYKAKDEGTQDDRGRDGGTNFILRIREQETHLILHEYEYDDDDDEFTYRVYLVGIKGVSDVCLHSEDDSYCKPLSYQTAQSGR